MVDQLQITDNLQNNIIIITINKQQQQDILRKTPLFMDTLLALIVVILVVVMALASSKSTATTTATETRTYIYFSTTAVVSNDVLVYRKPRIWCFR